MLTKSLGRNISKSIYIKVYMNSMNELEKMRENKCVHNQMFYRIQN